MFWVFLAHLLPAFCDSASQPTMVNSSGYIFNEKYPRLTDKTPHNCILNITKKEDEYLHIRSLDLQVLQNQAGCEQSVQLRRFDEDSFEVGEPLKFTTSFSRNMSQAITEVTYIDTCRGYPGIKMLLYYEGECSSPS